MKICISWALILSLLSTADPPLGVQIKTPRGGWTSQRVLSIRGTVEDLGLTKVRLFLNGEMHYANAHIGHFEARLPVRRGSNSLEAAPATSKGITSDQVTFYANPPPHDLQILLTWNTEGTDLDLHVTEPSGEQCYHGKRSNVSGGVLEVDDTDGFGPEVYLIPRAPLGEYRIAVAYYSSGNMQQTEAMVEIILREGTIYEKRQKIPLTLTQEGQMIEVGVFRVDPPSTSSPGPFPAAAD